MSSPRLDPVSELHHLTALEQLRALRAGELDPVELTEHYLARIERLNPELGAFVTVTADRALERARSLGSVSKVAALWGIPFADKDLVHRAGVPTSFGSVVFAGVEAPESDPLAVLFDDAGAVSLGKTTTPEFGMPAYTEPVIGPVARSPWNPAVGAGGSSGGAAIAVSAGLLPVAPGSDGGGSIRIPAAVTGLVGLKPSRGRVPALGGLDSLGGLVTAGPIARTVADAALLLDARATPNDRAVGPPDWNDGPYLGAAIRGEGRFQIGVLTATAWDTGTDIVLAPEARAALDLAIRELDALGHGLDDAHLPDLAVYPEAFRTLWQAGAAAIPLDDAQLERVESLTRWLVERGRALDARRLVTALAELSEVERRVIRSFAGFDAVLTPALAQTPRPLGWFDAEDGERNFMQQVQFTPYTSIANVAGLPAITLPVWHEGDLPMGVQLIGRPGGEHVLLSIGAQLERRLRWHRRHPGMW